jgi:hypothetical protein
MATSAAVPGEELGSEPTAVEPWGRRCQAFSALICSVFGFQDLNILRQFRRQGIASHMLDRVEAEVARHSGVVGIGVGLLTDARSRHLL